MSEKRRPVTGSSPKTAGSQSVNCTVCAPPLRATLLYCGSQLQSAGSRDINVSSMPRIRRKIRDECHNVYQCRPNSHNIVWFQEWTLWGSTEPSCSRIAGIIFIFVSSDVTEERLNIGVVSWPGFPLSQIISYALGGSSSVPDVNANSIRCVPFVIRTEGGVSREKALLSYMSHNNCLAMYGCP